MTNSTPILGRAATRGWCPGVLDPMETGDGWLLRMRLPGGVIQLRQMRVVATVANECGSGLVDVTSRGNLQIRGVRADSIERAGDELVAAGLALPDAAADAQRAIVGSPLAGHDALAVRDSSPVIAGLLARACAETLPSKFGLVVDDGGQWNLVGVDADVRVRAVTDGWAVGLRGNPNLVGWTAQPVDVLAAATKLCAGRGQRMSEIAADLGEAAVLETIGAEARAATVGSGAAQAERRLGVIEHHEPDRCNVVAAPFLGRVDARTLAAVADLADGCAAAVRFTTDHSVALCGVRRAVAPRLLLRLLALDFAVVTADPRAALSACVGARGCAAAHADTWIAAERIASATPVPQRVHLSGCAKGCGAPIGVAHLVADVNGSFR